MPRKPIRLPRKRNNLLYLTPQLIPIHPNRRPRRRIPLHNSVQTRRAPVPLNDLRNVRREVAAPAATARVHRVDDGRLRLVRPTAALALLLLRAAGRGGGGGGVAGAREGGADGQVAVRMHGGEDFRVLALAALAAGFHHFFKICYFGLVVRALLGAAGGLGLEFFARALLDVAG